MPRPGGTERLVIPELPHKAEGSPLIRLTGDEFAINAEASLYLLTDLTSEIAGGVLTNNGTVTFNFDSDHGYTVATLSGSNYLSRATETQFEVGTGSFMASIWFNLSLDPSGLRMMVNYGDDAASEQNWKLFFQADAIQAVIDDGTNTVTLVDPIKKRWQDGKWHHAQMLVDRTTDIMYLYVDGQEVVNGSISTVTLTLNNTGTDFAIGRNAAASGQFFNGSLANFHLIKAADYNAVQVLNQGIRESVISLAGNFSLAADSARRLNNVGATGSSSADGDYITTMIDVEEGEYDIQSLVTTRNNSGIIDIDIDNTTVETIDLYTAALTNNVLFEEKGIKLSDGKHILKIRIDGKNAASSDHFFNFNFFNLIKREGHEQGGATKFLLLGDEIDQRSNFTPWTVQAESNTRFYNTVSLENPGTPGDFLEGDLFLKGGLWEITYNSAKNTDRAAYNLDFGDVEVLDEDTTWDDTSVSNFPVTKLVRLNQGRNTVRLEIGSTAGGAVIELVSIRGERISD